MSQEEGVKSPQASSEDEVDASSPTSLEEQSEEIDDAQLEAVAGGDAGTDQRQQDISKWGG